MMRSAASLPPILVALLTALPLLSGCAGPGGTAPDDTIVVRAPDDYSYLDGTDPLARPHLHDYWGGAGRITLVDQTQKGVAQYFGAQDTTWIGFMEFLPGDGAVVPQGTSHLEARIVIEPMPGDRITSAAVGWSGAAGGEPDQNEPFVDGRVVVPSNNSQNDLPHQVLSAWRFWIRAHGEGGFFRFTGTIHLTVEAVRGLDIPLYPGHPDQWHGRSEILLLDQQGTVSDVYTTTPQEMCLPLVGYDPLPCPYPYRPDEGALVPNDAAFVEVRFTTSMDPAGLELRLHGGDSRRFLVYAPAEEDGDLRVYRIAVQGNGDGPYALASLWEFMVTATDVAGARGAVEAGDFHLAATAFRDAPAVPVPFSAPLPSGSQPGKQVALVPAPLAAPPSGCLDSHGTRPTDERDLLVVPLSQFSLEVRGQPTPFRLVIALCSGESLGGKVTVPPGCTGGTMSVHVIGASNGQTLADIQCQGAPEDLFFVLESGASTFSGAARLYGATFA